MSTSAEPQREREVQRYLQSWQVAQGSSLNVALNVESIAAPDLQSNGWKPKASPDRTLTAFAQLAVLRLDVRRAMVSLIDSTTQTILAEATQHIQLGTHDDAAKTADHETVNSTNSDLWLGAAILSRPDAVCEHSLINTCTALDSKDQPFTVPGLIVPDCRFDSRFSKRPYVLSEPGVRFYAGVPIFSRNGHRIGSFAVSDERPHDGLTVSEIKFMQGIAQTVMEHLEWARDRVDRFKGERIVRGLAAFVEDCFTLSEDPTLTKDNVSPNPSTMRPPEMPLISSKRPLSTSNSHFRFGSSGSPRASLSMRLRNEAPGSPPQSPPRHQRQTARPKFDSISNIYHRAAEILRRSTLADGVVFLGATATTSKQLSRSIRNGGSKSSDEDEQSVPVTSGSEGVGIDSSDSDTSPSSRPCKILSYSITDEQTRAGMEQGPPLSLGTLEKYFSLFPMGKTLSFTETGAGVSSEDDSASDREPMRVGPISGERSTEGRRRRVRMDHEELLKKIPGAKSVVFVPLFDYSEDRFAGGCFLWTSVTGRMMNLDQDLSYLRAFANSIMSQIGRVNTQKNEVAKTTFIASMSHELRSPLHGILGSAELLTDTETDTYQAGLISSISTCGKTLLDTLNHVLDYSKINRIGRAQMRKSARQNRPVVLSSDSLESLSMTAVVDLGVLVEEVVDTIAAGHAFKKLAGAGVLKPTKAVNGQLMEPVTIGKYQAPGSEGPVSVLLNICPRTSWLVKTQPGALRRIIMNLFGNALKYTSSGFVLVSLSSQPRPDGSKVSTLIRVADTGKGMSDDFQQNRLFVPFSQEDSFQPGTGLGLSIVKQIVDSLGGTLEVKSEQGRGTEVDVHLRLAPATGEAAHQPDELIRSLKDRTRGCRVVVLDGEEKHQPTSVVRQVTKLHEVLAETCTSWFGMQVERETPDNVDKADIYVYCEPPPIEALERRFRDPTKRSPRKIPIVIVCQNAEEAIHLSHKHTKILAEMSQIVEVIPQPCGPRKFAKVFSNCFKRVEAAAKLPNGELISAPSKIKTKQREKEQPNTSAKLDDRVVVHYDQPSPSVKQEVASTEAIAKSLDAPELQEEASNPQPAGRKDSKLHVLLVDDNKINLKLLVMFMKKCGFSYEEAENGQEAVDRFIEASGVLPLQDSPQQTKQRPFDFVLMDISMPVLNGFEATKRIREFEHEHRITPPANVVALTGLASVDARRNAESVGIDVFLPKPVRFAELKKLLSAGETHG
ncbi:sensor histidine kinase response [Colletotrichum truncatum]|uniref:Sensor histidine kinase response n=1 Tax=Colletotrichum truncatum TaxID=5467 RepID=A0ACC3ZBY0_COLTU|nr:sensor histidine kinase response [Colletotrichum truncatum]KAF6787840.1 sensor histidine kinase response [Colletotrichum truncatum]